MSISSSQSLETAPIPIDQSSDDIRLFIDMVHSSNTANLIIPTLSYKSILHICEQLQASELQSALWSGLQESLRQTSRVSYLYLWELFGMAAREDNNLLCSAICMAFYYKETHHDLICSQQPGFYDGIPPRYLATLLTGHFRWHHTHSGKAAYRMRTFYDLANRFSEMKEKDLDLRTADGMYVSRPE